MDYQLEIPGGIPLGAFDFIVTWNQLAESRAVARARLTAGTPQVFDLSTVNGTRLVLGNVTPGTTLESLHQLVRRVLARRGIHGPTAYEERSLEGGSALLVIVFTGQA